MYKVQFRIHRGGYKPLQLEGVYIPPAGVKLSVTDMKHDVTEFIKRELAERDKAFKSFNVEMTIFKKLKMDFFHHPKPESAIPDDQVDD